MNIESEFHYGWIVRALPSERGWIFKCHDPKGKICTYEKTYKTAAEALCAARNFVNRDGIKAVLLAVLQEWVELGKLESEEHLNLLESLCSTTHPAWYY